MGREVVVMHVAFMRMRCQRVDLLFHAQHVQGRHTQNLGFAAFEEGGTVYARNYVDLGRQLANIGQTAAVDADGFAQDALADNLLGDRANRGGDFLLPLSKLLTELVDRCCLNFIQASLALLLIGDRQCLAEVAGYSRFDGSEDIIFIVQEARELRSEERRVGKSENVWAGW